MKYAILTAVLMLLSTPALAADTADNLGWWDRTKEWFETTFTLDPSESLGASGSIDHYWWVIK